MIKSKCQFIHHPLSAQYQFHDEHPFDPIRYQLTLNLLEEIGALPKQQYIQIDKDKLATEENISLIHRSDYISLVKNLSTKRPNSSYVELADQYGLHTEDTPFFEGMHQAASAIVQGTIEAVEAVVNGKADRAFHMAGGLHHAFPERAAGFCIYNDAAIAIKYIQEKHPIKVIYVDTDVHHGDGVQFSFYSDSSVCTYSIHETGKFLFPGTGFQYEKGLENGYGYCYNVPVEPYTEDESWLECFETTLHKVVEHFKPDLIISQHGCDAHAFDPLSHIHCSMNIYLQMPIIIQKLADQYTNGKWVAIGGGGYDLWRVVPRAWSLVWLVMSGNPLVQQLLNEQVLLPTSWIDKWQPLTTDKLPSTWLDDPATIEPMPRKQEITLKNREVAKIVIQDI